MLITGGEGGLLRGEFMVSQGEKILALTHFFKNALVKKEVPLKNNNNSNFLS
jgi:hypothetical protein